MASTNEDATVLAISQLEDGLLLVVRHLPDRGTIEVGWWGKDENGVTARPPVFEIAAEAVELAALEDLLAQLGTVDRSSVGDGQEIAQVSLADGVQLTALRSGGQVALVRRPERDDLIVLPHRAAELLGKEMLPAARAKLAVLGFGMIQQVS